MRRTEPKVFLLRETQVNEAGLNAYLDEIGAKGWTTDANSGSEKLTEVMGRICYRAFGAGLNASISNVNIPKNFLVRIYGNEIYRFNRK